MLTRNHASAVIGTAASPAPTTPEEQTQKHKRRKPRAAGPPPVTPKEYHAYVSEFINDNNLSGFFDPNDPSVKDLAQRAAGQAEEVTTKYGLHPGDTAGLIKLALYDFVILCDDSGSMKQEQRIQTLMVTLRRVAEFATILAPSGISIRFLNYNGDGEFDNLVSLMDIEKRVGAVRFFGVTKLGGALDIKIVQPMIIQKAASNRLERPVIAVIITDGEPTFEPRDSLRNTILGCKKSPAPKRFGEAAAVFLVSMVGSSTKAQKFLNQLDVDKELEDMVYCSKDKLDRQLEIFQRCRNDVGYTTYLIELFLAALDSQTK